MKAKKHHHHKAHPHNQYVQFDHNADTDDFLYDKELKAIEMGDATNVQYNHEGDQDDLDLNMPAPEMRGSARQRMAEDESWNKFFQQGAIDQDAEESNWDKTNVQLSDEDILPRKKGQPFLYESELVQDADEERATKKSDEIQAIMEQQAKDDLKDNMNVQLDYAHIPHSEDTEDVYDDGEDQSYDHHHSKEWNAMVTKKADDLENEMKIEENEKIAAKKSAEE